MTHHKSSCLTCGSCTALMKAISCSFCLPTSNNVSLSDVCENTVRLGCLKKGYSRKFVFSPFWTCFTDFRARLRLFYNQAIKRWRRHPWLCNEGLKKPTFSCFCFGAAFCRDVIISSESVKVYPSNALKLCEESSTASDFYLATKELKIEMLNINTNLA